MTPYKVYLLETAELELDEAFAWYNEQKPGLGAAFTAEISRYMDSISQNPFKYAIKYQPDLRFATLRIFPYLIVFWINKDKKTAFVLSIFHSSRNPKKFEDYLK